MFVRAYRLILGGSTALAVLAVMLCGVGSATAATQVRAASGAIHAQSPAGVRTDARHKKRHHKAKKPAKPRPLARSTTPGPGSSPAIPPSSPGTPQCLVTAPPQLPPTGPGPTAVVGGIYSFGGPACDGGSTPAMAGTVEVFDSSGDVVATQTVTAGQTFDIPVSPGTYTVFGAPQADVSFGLGCRSEPVTAVAGESIDVEVVCNIA
jgi:hypothetical protein